MNVLVLNCGSSTVKFQLISTSTEAMQRNEDRRLARGVIERLGGEAILALAAGEETAVKSTAPLRDIRAAVEHLIRWCASEESGVSAAAGIHAAGHRVVHGGEQFTRSAVITPEVLAGIESCIDLAPLHNPNNLLGIRAVREVLGPALPQVAVFDTAFHQTLPEHAFLYAIPYSLYRRHGIRRYGFHGTSHRYVAHRYRQFRGIEKAATNIITLHLGHGCSAAAIRNGVSIDTSMGFTPLEGLVMGTRCGDIDAAVSDFLVHKEGMTSHQVENLFNSQSGLLGISGLTNDMRVLLEEIHEHADRRANLAIEMFCYRARKYIGAYLAAMDGAEAIVFTGGIGANSPEIRQRISAGLGWLGLELDAARNAAAVQDSEGPIQSDGSRLAAWVIPTDEELLIARDTVRAVGSR